jgi:ABC-type phosphate transport system permease subunit
MILRLKTKRFVFLAMLALVIEGIVFGVIIAFGHIGGEGPDLLGGMGLLLHALPLMLSEWLKLPGGPVENTLCIVFGTLQWFAVLYFWMWLIDRQKKTRPNQALLPTPTSVTDRADARSAPDAGAADL